MGLKRPTVVTLAVRCILCGESLRYRRDDTSILIKHLRRCHPGVSMTLLPCEPTPEKEKADTKTRRQKCLDALSSRSRCKMYKTTVETWRPGSSKITCPSCGKTGEPCIRKQRSKITRSQLAAMCLMGCWPICFLPCMLANNPISDLHCCFCSYYLGSYNSKLQKLIPNQTSTTELKMNCKKCEFVDICKEGKPIKNTSGGNKTATKKESLPTKEEDANKDGSNMAKGSSRFTAENNNIINNSKESSKISKETDKSSKISKENNDGGKVSEEVIINEENVNASNTVHKDDNNVSKIGSRSSKGSVSVTKESNTN